MALLPKKGSHIRSTTPRKDFTAGCEYQVERIDNKIGHVYVYNDNGDLTPIDYPHDVVYGKFEKAS
jgi:hypothetical protein